MRRDPFESVLRLNRLAREAAMRDLAACLATEAKARSAVARIEASIEREEAAASAVETGDLAVEAFGRWLRPALARRDGARQERDMAEAGTVRARAVLGAARAAVAAVEGEIARRAETARHQALRNEQTALDDHARSRHGRNKKDE